MPLGSSKFLTERISEICESQMQHHTHHTTPHHNRSISFSCRTDSTRLEPQSTIDIIPFVVVSRMSCIAVLPVPIHARHSLILSPPRFVQTNTVQSIQRFVCRIAVSICSNAGYHHPNVRTRPLDTPRLSVPASAVVHALSQQIHTFVRPGLIYRICKQHRVWSVTRRCILAAATERVIVSCLERLYRL